MGRGISTKPSALRALLSRSREAKNGVADPSTLPFTGTCPVREHTGDGNYVGPCEHATHDGYCPRHGDVKRFLPENPLDYRDDNVDYGGADDRQLPPHSERDFGPFAHKRRY
jgi:hypothetical protein